MPVDDARIRQLTQEVLGKLRGGSAAPEAADDACAASAEAPGPEVRVHVHVHASAGLIGPPGSVDGRCVLEPDKPCVGSGQCRALGH